MRWSERWPGRLTSLVEGRILPRLESCNSALIDRQLAVSLSAIDTAEALLNANAIGTMADLERLGSIMKTLIHRLCVTALCAASALVLAEERTILVLDASGSMWGQLDGRTKIDIARSALKTLLADWPEDRQVGLVVYGHRSKGDCADIETMVPVGPLDANGMGKTVDAITPKGMTPLSAAVKQAAEALKYTENKATVVLLSDGKETCDLDPCALGAELEQLGVDFTAHVIGFDVTKTEDQAGLRCLAENTGGRFIVAANAGELNQALKETAKAPEPIPAPAPPAPAPAPTPTAELLAPESAVKGTQLKVEVKAADGLKGYVYLFPKGRGQHLGFASVRPAATGGYQPLQLRLPARVGDYTLKWITDDKQVLGERPLSIIDAEVTLAAPESATAGTLVRVMMNAPDGLDGNLYLFAQGKTQHLDFSRVRAAPTGGYQPCDLRLPAIPGPYTLKWLSDNKEVLATAPLTVVAAEIALEAPTTAIAGTQIQIGLKAPEGLSGRVILTAKGKDQAIDTAPVREDKHQGYQPVRLRLPTTPGEYQVAWIAADKAALAQASLTATPVRISLAAPNQVEKGTALSIGIEAPDGLDGRLCLFAPGKKSALACAQVREDKISGYTPVRLKVPEQTGPLTLKWLNGRNEVLVEQPMTVVEEIVEGDQG